MILSHVVCQHRQMPPDLNQNGESWECFCYVFSFWVLTANYAIFLAVFLLFNWSFKSDIVLVVLDF